MQTNCVKVVEKYVYKYANFLFKKTVEFFNSVNKKIKFSRISQLFQLNTQRFSTAKIQVSNLLNVSFTRFPQTSTITTNIFIKEIKKEVLWK